MRRHLVSSLHTRIAQVLTKDPDYRIAKEAEASLYAEKKQAEAVIAKAEAAFFAKKKEAEAMTEMAKAYGQMSDVLGGPQGYRAPEQAISNQCGLTSGRLLQYMMLQDNTFEKLAKANATAINGLQPKITVWNTGEGSGSSNDGTGAIRNIMQSLPPLLSTINEQTGIAPPSWLAQMGSNQSQALSKAKGKGATTNGEVHGH